MRRALFHSPSSFIISIIVLFFLSSSSVFGYKNTPQVCKYPGEAIGSHPAPKTTGSPYSFTVPATVSAGATTSISISGGNFIGFLLYVSDAAGNRVGSFVPSTFTDASISVFTACDTRVGGTSATLRHTTSGTKRAQAWGWKAPTTGSGTLTISALVMSTFSNYYLVTQQFTLAAAPVTTAPPATTVPTTPIVTATTNGGAATTTTTKAATTTTKAATTVTTKSGATTTKAATTAPTNSPTEGPITANNFLTADGKFFMSWLMSGTDSMDFTMAIRGRGWVSIGICNGPLMSNVCDYITGWINNAGQVTLLDTYADQYNIPKVDCDNGGTNDVQLISSTSVGILGGTSITFRRKFLTGDTKDVAISSCEQYIQWAYTDALTGTETKTNYALHDDDGYFQANLLSTAGGGGIPPVTNGPPNNPAMNSYTSADNAFQTKWMNNGDGTVDITMSTKGKGYVSWGLCNGPLMKDRCDYITGWINTAGQAILLDTYSSRYNVPPLDADMGGTNDVQLLSSTTTGPLGGTSFTFRRKLNTGDTVGDVIITDSIQYIQWAYSLDPLDATADKTNYPIHDDDGYFQTNLLSASTDSIVTNSPTTTTQAAAGTVSGFSYTAKGGMFSFNWQIIADKIRVTMTAPTTGWISVGWCDGVKMANNCDYITGGVDTSNGQPYLYDTYASGYDMPPIDTNNDVTLISAVETANPPRTTVTFERLLDTKDPQDHIIPQTEVYSQWSYGDSDGNIQQKVYPIHPDGGYGAVYINFFQGSALDVSEVEAPVSGGAWLLFISTALFGSWVLLRYARKARKAMKAAEMKTIIKNVYRDNAVELFHPVSHQGRGNGQIAIHVRNGSRPPMVSDAAVRRWREQWIPIQTDDGHTYYYNANLQETAWEIPPMPELFGNDYPEMSVPPPPTPSNRRSAPSAMTAQLRLEAKKGGGCCTAAHVLCTARLPCTQLSISDFALFGGFLALNALCFYLLDYSSSVPNKLGYLASANFVLVCIPATRNSPLIWLLGFPFDRVIVFHRWLAPWAFFVTTLHMGTYLQQWKDLQLDANKMMFKNPLNLYGFLSWFFTAIILITSFEYFRRRFFNFFYFAHFTFVLVFAFAYLHVPKKFLPYLIAIFVVYGIDRLVRFLWSVQCTSTVKLVPKDSDILLVRFRKNWLAKALNLYKIGQYVFINFPGISPLAWHPFTLSSSPEEQTAEVHIRGLGDYTKKLIDQVKMNNGAPMMIRVDGPYGNHRFTYRRYPSLLLFGGGIGITPIVAMLRDIYRVGDFRPGTTRPPHVIQSIYVAWIVPNVEKYKWFQSELDQVWKTIAAEGNNPAVAGQPNGLPYLSIWVYASRDSDDKCNQWTANNMGTTFVAGKPDFGSIFKTVKGNHPDQAVSVFACGPASLTQMAWDECSSMSSKGHRFDFHHETFDW